ESQLDYILNGPDVFREIYADGEFVGTIAAYIDQYNSVANVGILVGKKIHWGKGHGYAAWKMFCDAFFKAGIRKIEAGCMVKNQAMIRICNRYCMFHEGVRSLHFKSGEKEFSDMLMFGKFNDQKTI